MIYIAKYKPLELKSYKIDKNNDYTQYVLIDNLENYYIFRETSVMDYTVILDTYTIDLPEFLEKYENAKYEVIPTDTLETVSGEVKIPDGVLTSGDEYLRERTVTEIASIIGLNKEETENIKTALANKDEDTLAYYKDKLVTETKSIVSNYPVRTEVATLIKNNPNILAEIKQKYDIAELEARRATLMEADYYKYQVDMDGNLVLDSNGKPIRAYDANGNPAYNEDYIKSVDDRLKTEIETQKSERQEYLLALIQKQRAATTTTTEK